MTDNYSDVNRILYCSGRANEPNVAFIEKVLTAEMTVTALEERAIFEDIVKEVAGEQLDAATIAQVYEEIHRVIESNEEEEPPKLDYKDVERMLMVSGVEDVTREKVERAFQNVVDDKTTRSKRAASFRSSLRNQLKLIRR